jgi:hypothetical protein
MKFQQFVMNENILDKSLSIINRLPFNKVKKFLKGEFDKFVEIMKTTGKEKEALSIFNKFFGTRYHSFEEIQKQHVNESDDMINEDLAHWWETVKSEAFPTLAFYPALTVWLEIDKLFNDQPMDIKKTVVYASLWMLLVSGKYVNGWLKWKKQNPDELHNQ